MQKYFYYNHFGVGFSGDALYVDVVILAILREREGVEVNLIVTSGQVCGQFST